MTLLSMFFSSEVKVEETNKPKQMAKARIRDILDDRFRARNTLLAAIFPSKPNNDDLKTNVVIPLTIMGKKRTEPNNKEPIDKTLLTKVSKRDKRMRMPPATLLHLLMLVFVAGTFFSVLIISILLAWVTGMREATTGMATPKTMDAASAH